MRRRISLALALLGAIAVAGCGGGAKPSSKTGSPGSSGSTFTVTVRIEGSGTVVSSPAGIHCVGPATCQADFAYGQGVTLSQTTSEYFNGWLGDCSGYACALSGNAEKYVVAYFSATPQSHPNFTDPAIHALEIGNPDLVCTSCHGANLQGMGLAVACTRCHTSPGFVAMIQASDANKVPANRKPVEICASCHAGPYAPAASHALSEQLGVKVASASASVSGTDVVVTFNVKVNGVNRDDFVNKASVIRAHNEDAYWYFNPNVSDPLYTQAAPNNVGPSGIRPKITLGNFTLVSSGNGNYTATLPGLPAVARADGTKFMLSVMNGTPTAGNAATYGSTATVVATLGAATHDLVSDQACVNCHGQLVWRDAVHDVTYPQGVGPCIVCHSRAGSADPRLPGAGSGLMGIVHGIHNSAAMPDGKYTFTWTNGNRFDFSKGFPGNMHNCATCHDSPARLAAVKDAPVSYGLCISCHDSFASFPDAPTSHLAFTATSGESCTASCHTGARATLGGYHDGLETERAGLIWGGADQSVVLAPTIQVAITGIARSGSNLVVAWTAKNASGASYNPCNGDYAQGPVFFNIPTAGLATEGCTNSTLGCGNTFSILRAYATGDDWIVNAYPSSSSPGQPRSTSLTSANTTCADSVATSTVPLEAIGATRGIVAIQGKPQVRFAANGNVIWVRAQTATREFLVADGTLPAAIRREIVDVDRCNACHLGTLYQHGGSRVDSIELCVMCHNPASSEQNNRVGLGVTAATAYDGKAGQTYDLRTMVHAIHAAGDTKVPLMYYRNNGVFFFGSKDASGKLLGIANWPDAAACVQCVDAEDGPLSFCKVYGSAASGPDYTTIRNPDGTCKDTATLPTSTSGTWRPHRVTEVHYPRPLNDCSACHLAAPGFPDATKALAVTYGAGAAPWNDLLDDLLVGASNASCMSCHQSADAAKQVALRDHAYGYGWKPQAFPAGAQTILNWATCAAATCP